MKALPSLPSLFLEVTETLKSPNVSIPQVCDLITRDVGMTAKILQLVNSAFFGQRRRVDNLARALSLLGFDTIKTLVLSLQVFSQCTQEEITACSLDTLWDHSFMTGVLARQIAQVERQAQSVVDGVFTAGILHDCGKLVLAKNLTEAYGMARPLACAEYCSIQEAERAIFGVSHAEVGAYLLGLWGLPDTIVETVAFHHSPTHCLRRAFGPLAMVHVAEGLEHERHAGRLDLPPILIEEDYLADLGLSDRLPLWRQHCETLAA
jgi:HD-like signal output (HDOD) protein